MLGLFFFFFRYLRSFNRIIQGQYMFADLLASKYNMLRNFKTVLMYYFVISVCVNIYL